MKFKRIQQSGDGKYLRKYILTYENKAGNEKQYEIASRSVLSSVEDLGKHVSGISIVATRKDEMVLLHEFRMAVNRPIYNLIAGMIEEQETPEECIKREVFEETGLKVISIDKLMRPSFSAVGISDTKTYIAFVTVDGMFSDHTSDNEEIKAAFYSKEQIREMLETEDFSSRAQMVAYFFSKE